MFKPRVFIYDPNSTYIDQVVSVKLPNDGLDEKELKAMSGECITVKEGVKPSETSLSHL